MMVIIRCLLVHFNSNEDFGSSAATGAFVVVLLNDPSESFAEHLAEEIAIPNQKRKYKWEDGSTRL